VAVPRQLMPLRRINRRILLEMNLPTTFGKTDLVHFIANKLKLTNYLEICTSSTGARYWQIEGTRFNRARRLMYNCPMDFDDGFPIDYKIVGFDIANAIAELKLSAERVDVCLVDGWHTYDCAIRDLTGAYEMLADGGVLVVHDCSPATERIASSNLVEGEWSGVSYRSYLNFVLARQDLYYCTVDVDYGCGIIFKSRTVEITGLPACEPKVIAEWFGVQKDDQLAFKFFSENRAKLLRLVSAKSFVHGLNRR